MDSGGDRGGKPRETEVDIGQEQRHWREQSRTAEGMEDGPWRGQRAVEGTEEDSGEDKGGQRRETGWTLEGTEEADRGGQRRGQRWTVEGRRTAEGNRMATATLWPLKCPGSVG